MCSCSTRTTQHDASATPISRVYESQHKIIRYPQDSQTFQSCFLQFVTFSWVSRHEQYRNLPTLLIVGLTLSSNNPLFYRGKEFRESGLKGLSTKSIAPYLVNAGIAMVMFHTYTTTRLHLHALALQYPMLKEMPLGCEAISGASAGIMQATLHSPLYNVRLCREEEWLGKQSVYCNCFGGVCGGVGLFVFFVEVFLIRNWLAVGLDVL